MRWQDVERVVSSFAEVSWSTPHKWRLSLRLASLSVSALLSFACAWALGNSYEEFELATQQAQRLKVSQEAVGVAESRLRDLQAQSQESLQRIEHHSQGFLLADELPDLLDLIARLSLERAITLESLEVESVLSQQRIDLQPLSLSLRGTYQAIGLLHLEFSNLPWPMVVDALQVTTEEGDGRVLKMRVRLLVPLLSGSA